MRWEYRVFKSISGEYGFIEVYYSLDGKILNYTDFVDPMGKTLNDLELDIEKMAAALNKPVLEEQELNTIPR